MRMLTILLNILRSAFRSRAAVELENFALRHQLNVLKRSVKQRPKLMPTDRLLWLILLPSSNLKPSSPGIAKDFASSGLGKFGAVNRAVRPFPVRSAI